MILFFNVSSPHNRKEHKAAPSPPYNREAVMEAIREITGHIGNIKCPVHRQSVGFVTLTFKGEKLTYVVSTCCSMVGPVLEVYLSGSAYPYRLFFRAENEAWKSN